MSSRTEKTGEYAIYKITGPKDLCYVGITQIHWKEGYIYNDGDLICYVEQPEEAIDERFKRHCRDRKKRQTKLQKAMFRHGLSKFSVALLDTAEDLKQARKKERMNIIKQKANLNTVDTKTLEGYFFVMQEMIDELETTMTEILSGKERLIRKTMAISNFVPTKDPEKLEKEISKHQVRIDLARNKLSKIKADVDFYSNKIVKDAA
jgi:transcription antitermination factor NusG